MEDQSIADLMSALQMTQQKSSVVRSIPTHARCIMHHADALGMCSQFVSTQPACLPTSRFASTSGM